MKLQPELALITFTQRNFLTFPLPTWNSGSFNELKLIGFLTCQVGKFTRHLISFSPESSWLTSHRERERKVPIIWEHFSITNRNLIPSVHSEREKKKLLISSGDFTFRKFLWNHSIYPQRFRHFSNFPSLSAQKLLVKIFTKKKILQLQHKDRIVLLRVKRERERERRHNTEHWLNLTSCMQSVRREDQRKVSFNKYWFHGLKPKVFLGLNEAEDRVCRFRSAARRSVTEREKEKIQSLNSFVSIVVIPKYISFTLYWTRALPAYSKREK